MVVTIQGMPFTIQGTPEEIAALVLAVQERHSTEATKLDCAVTDWD